MQGEKNNITDLQNNNENYLDEIRNSSNSSFIDNNCLTQNFSKNNIESTFSNFIQTSDKLDTINKVAQPTKSEIEKYQFINNLNTNNPFHKKNAFHKHLFILPSVFTSLNLICGYASILFSSQNEFLLAGWFVVLAVVCDILDGRIARYSSLTSKFGAELDSLADLVSFGVAPAFLVYKRYFVENQIIGAICSSIFVLCGALRLARFNITPPSEKDVFIGLPIPAGAGILCTLTISEIQYYPYFKIPEYLIPIIVFATSILMISTIEYPAMKKTQKTSLQRKLIALASFFIFLFFPPLYLLIISWGFAFYGLFVFTLKKIYALYSFFFYKA